MDEWFNGTSVNLLTGAEFDNKEPWKIRDKRCAFVLFFASWCGHCSDLKPEYIKFADVAQFIKVDAIDSDAEASLLDKFRNERSPVHINGFPTIWIYNNGVPYKEYAGPRTWQGLLNEAVKVCDAGCKCAKRK
jgi:thiol-disulfide isomerase/thioredoxin